MSEKLAVVCVCVRIDEPEYDSSHIVGREKRMEGWWEEQEEEYCSPLILTG